MCVAQLEGCLKEVLPHILEVEMKAAFEELWEDVGRTRLVCLTSPTSLQHDTNQSQR